MRITRRVAAGGLVLGVSGCVFDSARDHVDGPYILLAIDGRAYTRLAYEFDGGSSIGRVSSRVIAVGWNSDYIVATRSPTDWRDASISPPALEYYYVVRALDHKYADPEDCVRGPFDEAAFAHEANRLALPALDHESWLLR